MKMALLVQPSEGGNNFCEVEDFKKKIDALDAHNIMRKMYQCELCECKYSQKFVLSQHIRRVHKKETPFKCTVCPFQAVIKSELTQHLQRKHSISDKSFPCKFCDEVLKRPKDLCIHECSHTGMFFTCNTCQKRFALKCSYKQHLKSHLKTKCKFCQRAFQNLDALKRHETSHLERNNEAHDRGKFLFSSNLHFIKKCNLCNQAISGVTELKLHVLKEHLHLFGVKAVGENELPTWNGAGECPICSRQVKTKSVRFSHLLSHIGILMYKCHLCDYTTSWVRSVNIHLLSHSKVKQEWKCETCKLIFKYRTHYTLHCKKHGEHKGLSLYLCEHCGEGCSTEKYLKKHKNKFHSSVDHEDDFYYCTRCKIKFKYSFNFELHMKRIHQRFCANFPGKESLGKYNKHSRLRECRVCEVEFGSMSLVEKHEKLNNMQRACFLCANGTLIQHGDFISLHMKEHHLSECLKCDLCDRIFACPQSFNKHLNSHFCPKEGINYNVYHPSYDSEDEEMFLISREISKETAPNLSPDARFSFMCECGVCGINFASCKELIKHEASHKTLSRFPTAKTCPVRRLQNERVRKAWEKVKNIKIIVDSDSSAAVDFTATRDSADALKFPDPHFQIESSFRLTHTDNTRSPSMQLSDLAPHQDITKSLHPNTHSSTLVKGDSFTTTDDSFKSDSYLKVVGSGHRVQSSTKDLNSSATSPYSSPRISHKHVCNLNNNLPKKESDKSVWGKQTEPTVDDVAPPSTQNIKDDATSPSVKGETPSLGAASNHTLNTSTCNEQRFCAQTTKHKEFDVNIRAGVRKVKEKIEEKNGRKRVVIEDQGFYRSPFTRSS